MYFGSFASNFLHLNFNYKMKLFTIICYLFFVSFSVAAPVDTANSGVRVAQEVDLRSLNEALLQLAEDKNRLVTREEQDELIKRENVLLTQSFTALNQSGTGVALVDAMASNPATQPIVIQAVIEFLKEENLTNIFIALDKSGLATDFIMMGFEDPTVFPGLIKIVKGLIQNGSIKLKRDLSKIDLEQTNEIVARESESTLVARESQDSLVARDDPNLDSLCVSLEKSGLAISVAKSILTDPKMYPFAIRLVTDIIQAKVLTLNQVYTALKNSGLVLDTFESVLGNAEYRHIIIQYFINLVKLGFISAEKLGISKVSSVKGVIALKIAGAKNSYALKAAGSKATSALTTTATAATTTAATTTLKFSSIWTKIKSWF